MASKKRKKKESKRQGKRKPGVRGRGGSNTGRGQPAQATAGPALPDLDYPDTDRLTEPMHIDAMGARVADPWRTLGLTPGTLDADVVQAAWRRLTLAHPPEREPARARSLLEARDRLLSPQRVIERELGVVRFPDPKAWGLEEGDGASDQLDAEGRMLGQLVLYALLEDALLEPEVPQRPSEQIGLFR